MGISSTVPIQFYLGNGSSTVFGFPNEFFTQNDLQVFLFDTIQGVVYPQTIGPNYTISGPQNLQGAYPNGGNVTVTSSFPSTTELIIFRNPSPVNQFVLNQNSPINSLALTQQLDYITTLVQALQYNQSQSLSLPLGTGQINGSSFSMLLPSTIGLASSALMVLQVNSGATGWQLSPLTGSSGGGGGGGFTGSTNLTNQVSGILPFANGGTNFGGNYSISGLIFASSGQEFFSVPPGTPGQFLTFQGSSTPTWTSGGASTGSTNLTNQVVGILPLANGGTNAVGPYSISGVIYGSGGAQFASVPPGTPGQVLTFQGSSAPNWSNVSAAGSTSLTTQVSGILPTANGGTNNAGPYQLAGVIFASTATQFAAVPPGTPGQVLTFQGSSTPTWATVAAGSVSLTTGVTGILPITSGGTGASSSVFNALSPITGGGQIITGTGNPITNYALPAGAGGQFLQQNAASNGLQWTTLVAGSGTIISIVTTTCSMVVSSATNMVIANSGAMTLTLPSVSGNSGIGVNVKKADSGAGIVTIVGSGAALIDGTSFVLIAQYEQVHMVCDGTNWQVLDYYYSPVSARAFVGSGPVSSALSTLTWTTKDYDKNNLINLSTGIMTSNRAGLWEIKGSAGFIHTAVAGDNTQINLVKNGNIVSVFYNNAATSLNNQCVVATDVLNLNLNDQVTFKVADANTNPTLAGGSTCWVSFKYLGQN